MDSLWGFRNFRNYRHRVGAHTSHANAIQTKDTVVCFNSENKESIVMDIPHIIYTFWHNGRPSTLVRSCISRMRKHHPGWKVRVLTDSDLPPGYKHLEPAHRADTARLFWLVKTGGVWLDSSIILYGAVTEEWISIGSFQIIQIDPTQTETHGVELWAFGAPFDEQLVENWALAAPPGSLLMREWLAEWKIAVCMGFPAYVAKHTGEIPIKLMPRLPYLTMHACVEVVHSGIPYINSRF